MSKSAEAILLDIYDAWNAHDLQWLASYLPADFTHVINIPEEMHPLGGARHGKQAVLDRLRRIFEQFDTQQLRTSQLIVGVNSASVDVRTHCLHRQSGVWLDVTKTNEWVLEDGWPTRLNENYDLDAFQAFMKAAVARDPTFIRPQ